MRDDGARRARETGRASGRPVSPARAAAWRALVRLREGGRLDDSLTSLPELQDLDVRDRGLANELVIGTIKRRGSIDAVLGGFTKAPLASADDIVLCGLRLAAFQILFLDRVPAHAAVDDAVALLAAKGPRVQGFANAVLRKVATQGRARLAELSAGNGDRAWSLRYSCPAWLVRLLRCELGDQAAARVLDVANAPPERCLRVNTVRGPVDEAIAALKAAGFSVMPAPGLPEGLLYDGPPLERSALFRAGHVTPQSRGSQLAALVAARGVASPGTRASTAPPRVLDLCAAPGAKTSQLAAALPGAAMTAVDVDVGRLASLEANLARLGVVGVETLAADALDLPEAFNAAFAGVLLDAPCSGLGTLASRPDLRWRRRAADVQRLAELQRRLIKRAARCVQPGGTLTYAVCTLSRMETADVVRTLLHDEEWSADDLGATWPELADPALPEALLLVPPAFGTTGFFIARLRRAGW